MRSAEVLISGQAAGFLRETVSGYEFAYYAEWLESGTSAVSLTLPLEPKLFVSKVLFPFFDGLIPEGWLLDIAQNNWKLDPRDRMGLLLACCRDCIGNISVIRIEG